MFGLSATPSVASAAPAPAAAKALEALRKQFASARATVDSNKLLEVVARVKAAARAMGAPLYACDPCLDTCPGVDRSKLNCPALQRFPSDVERQESEGEPVGGCGGETITRGEWVVEKMPDGTTRLVEHIYVETAAPKPLPAASETPPKRIPLSAFAQIAAGLRAKAPTGKKEKSLLAALQKASALLTEAAAAPPAAVLAVVVRTDGRLDIHGPYPSVAAARAKHTAANVKVVPFGAPLK